MAIDVFLKITGIPGESKDSKHKDEIDIFSFSWGLAQAEATGHAGGSGAAAGKANFSDFNFMVPVSKASPKLFLACAKGDHIADARLTLRKAGENPVEFLVYNLSDCQVTSYQESASSELPTDSFSLSYGKIEISYKEQNEKGGLGDETRAGWDLKQNREF
jgi:type VI secretion system secreted protein Hcp